MPMQAPFMYKADLLRRWPARLDQELRLQFGDSLSPKTSFSKEAKCYVTDYVGRPITEVDMFVTGFYAAVTMVTE